MALIAKMTEITDREAIETLRNHIKALPPRRPPEYVKGEAVRLDNGCLGVVSSDTDEEDITCVVYLDEDGHIKGPSFGWRLEKLDF